MEATGVYWKPVWAVLAGDFELGLANAHHVKAVPGRKTDGNDATWLADPLAHGLIRPSFVPSISEQALRDLTRARKQLTRKKAVSVTADPHSGRGQGRRILPCSRGARGRRHAKGQASRQA